MSNKPGIVDLILRDCRIASIASASDFGILNNAAIVVDKGKILWLGFDNDLPKEYTARKSLVLDGLWVTPGLIDPHTHLVYGGNRADEFEMRLNGVSYEDIAKQGGGIKSTVKMTRQASKQALFESSIKRLQSWLSEGVTGIEIKSGYGLDKETEIKMLEVIQDIKQKNLLDVSSTYLGAHTLPEEYRDDADAYIDWICAEILPEIKTKNLADSVDAFCEGIGFSPAQVSRVLEQAQKLGLKRKLHAEQLSDLQGAKLAAELGSLSADHLEYVSEESIQAMQRASTVAVLLPGAFYSLRETQKPPVELFRQYGVSMALATDSNPGSSPCQSLLLVVNMACVLFGLTPTEALAGVTLNAAKALGWQDQGTVQVGCKANLAFWDISHPNELAYYFGRNPCVGRVYQGELTWH